MSEKIKYPFGPADEVALSAGGAQAVDIDNMLTIVDGATTAATADRTLNLEIDDNLEAGARIFLKSKTTADEATAFGTGMSGADIAGAAGKTKCVEFVYDGSNFVEAGTPVQID